MTFIFCKDCPDRVLYCHANCEKYLAEKERLEKRLTAIKKAKELFMRAKENMAAKYLQPVEEKCAEYLSFNIGNCFKYSSVTLFSMLSRYAGSINAIQHHLNPAPEKRPP